MTCQWPQVLLLVRSRARFQCKAIWHQSPIPPFTAYSPPHYCNNICTHSQMCVYTQTCTDVRTRTHTHTELSVIRSPYHVHSGWPGQTRKLLMSAGIHVTILCLFKQLLKTAHHVTPKCKISEQTVRSLTFKQASALWKRVTLSNYVVPVKWCCFAENS